MEHTQYYQTIFSNWEPPVKGESFILPQDSIVANFATIAEDGKAYRVTGYNLGIALSVGYRVEPQREGFE